MVDPEELQDRYYLIVTGDDVLMLEIRNLHAGIAGKKFCMAST